MDELMDLYVYSICLDPSSFHRISPKDVIKRNIKPYQKVGILHMVWFYYFVRYILWLSSGIGNYILIILGFSVMVIFFPSLLYHFFFLRKEKIRRTR